MSSLLLGPRGGLPKTKGKLILLAEAWGLDTSGTVEQLRVRCAEAKGSRRDVLSEVPPSGVGAGAIPSNASNSSAIGSAIPSASVVEDLQAQIAALQSQLLVLDSQRIPANPTSSPTTYNLSELPPITEGGEEDAIMIQEEALGFGMGSTEGLLFR